MVPCPPGRGLSEVSCSLLTETVTCLGEPPHLRSLNKVQAVTRVSPVSRSIPGVTAWVTQAPVLCPVSLVTAVVEVWVFSCPSAADPGSSSAVLVFELPTVSSHQLFALKTFFFNYTKISSSIPLSEEKLWHGNLFPPDPQQTSRCFPCRAGLYSSTPQ